MCYSAWKNGTPTLLSQGAATARVPPSRKTSPRLEARTGCQDPQFSTNSLIEHHTAHAHSPRLGPSTSAAAQLALRLGRHTLPHKILPTRNFSLSSRPPRQDTSAMTLRPSQVEIPPGVAGTRSGGWDLIQRTMHTRMTASPTKTTPGLRTARRGPQ
jgi:hypothetical protein